MVGWLRYAEHRSVPEVRTNLVGHRVAAREWTVTSLLKRYDDLLAVADDRRLKRLLAGQGRVVLALNGLRPDVGHEVLWVVRDALSSEVLLAKNLLPARRMDLAELLARVRDACPVLIAGVVADGQHSIRWAVATCLPGVPYQLCQVHDLWQAARPIFKVDRHAKKCSGSGSVRSARSSGPWRAGPARHSHRPLLP